jgi:hypothetical protein
MKDVENSTAICGLSFPSPLWGGIKGGGREVSPI